MLGRAVCNIAFLERPLTLGLAWWLLTGEYDPALPLAIFFELFWLDLIPIGSYIPPMPAFPYLALLALSATFGWNEPASLAFPLAMSLPLAYLVPYVEAKQRNGQKSAYSKLLNKSRKIGRADALAGRLLAASALQQLVLGLALFFATLVAAHASLAVAEMQHFLLFPIPIEWTVLFVIAALGAFLALRIRRAYVVFTLAVAGGLASRFLF